MHRSGQPPGLQWGRPCSLPRSLARPQVHIRRDHPGHHLGHDPLDHWRLRLNLDHAADDLRANDLKRQNIADYGHTDTTVGRGRRAIGHDRLVQVSS